MSSVCVPYWHRRNAATESRYHGETKPRKLSKFLQTLKSCFGHGSVEVDTPSRDVYRRAGDPATGFEGEEVYGTQAEYLDEDNTAWGKPKKQTRQNYESSAR